MNISDGSSIYPDGKVFGRFQFVQESPGVAITSILVLTMASIIGNFGNILILVAVFKTLKTKSLKFIFVGNLAVSDSFVTSVVTPINILGTFVHVLLSLTFWAHPVALIYMYIGNLWLICIYIQMKFLFSYQECKYVYKYIFYKICIQQIIWRLQIANAMNKKFPKQYIEVYLPVNISTINYTNPYKKCSCHFRRHVAYIAVAKCLSVEVSHYVQRFVSVATLIRILNLPHAS